jgi:hypothetical protein
VRYAGITTALALVSALVDVKAAQAARAARLERQLAALAAKATDGAKKAESKKGDKDGGNSQQAALNTELRRVRSSVSQLDDRVGAHFEHFVAKMCRDVCAAVRRDVVSALGGWTAADAAAFVVDSRLKYLAWGMSDIVRLLVVPLVSSA